MTGVRDRLEIHLFGGFSVMRGSEPLPPLPSRTGRLLFAYLALHAGQPQPRSFLVDLFWSDVDEARGRRRLSHVLWQVQDVLEELAPGQTFVRATGDSVTFDASEDYWLDVEEFSARVDGVEQSRDLPTGAERELRRCVDLYRGDLLAGYYEPWVIDEQQRLSHRYVTALSRLVELCKARGNFDDALTFARRITHESPLREDAHREVMRLCVLLGQPGQALEQFERCKSVLAEELDAEPDAQTVELAARIAATRQAPTVRRPANQFVSDRLVGRSREREVLLDELEAALAGRGRIVMVEGAPGIGKSRLLGELAGDAAWRGFTVLWGACDESSASVPYSAVRRALEPELLPVRVAQLRHAHGPVWLDVASLVLPQLAGTGSPAASLHGPEQTDRLREALSRILIGLTEHAPVMLVLEDLHWADDETLGLLQLLGRQTPAGRLVVVLSFRDLQAREDERTWAVLRTLDRDARPRRIQLAGLTPFEIVELAAEVLKQPDIPPALASRLHRESGGNPLFALELLRALRDRGSVRGDGMELLDDLEIPVTSDLRSLIADRLGLVDRDTRGVLEVAAVAGEECRVEVLGRAAGLDGPTLTAALGRLLAANLLEQTEHGCRFAHAVTRRVVLEGVPDEARATLHRAVGQALAEFEPDRIEALATHFAEAGDRRTALGYRREAAARALNVHAYATAARHLTAALDLMASVPVSTDERFMTLLQLAEVLDVLGERSRQAQVLAELRVLAAGDIHRELDVAQRRALLLGHTGQLDKATQSARDALLMARTIAPDRAAEAAVTLGNVLSWSGDNVAAIEVLSEFVEQVTGEDPIATELLFVLGTALRFVQQYDLAEARLRTALEIAQRRTDDRAVTQLLGALADLHTELGHTPAALDDYTQAITLARQIGYRHREGVSLVNRGNLLQSTVHPVDARASYNAAEQIFTDLGNQRGVAMVQLNRAWLHHRWFGDDDAARTDAEAARAFFADSTNPASEALCLETLAGIHRRRGHHAQAATYLDKALSGARQADEHRAEVQILRGMTELALATRDHDRAVEHAERAMATAARLGLVDLQADLRSLQAIALIDLDSDQAWAAAQAAVTCIADALEPHRVHHRIGVVASRSGNNDAATHHAAHAQRIYQRATTDMTEREQRMSTDQDPEHREIMATAEHLLPRTIDVPMAPRSGPRGRPLDPDEHLTVTLALGPRPSNPQQRREQILEVLRQTATQDAEATVAAIASIFDVSTSTVRRDLDHLRRAGHDARTRGTGIG